MSIRTTNVVGGVLIAGFAALSILSYNSLRNDITRVGDMAYWAAVKDSGDTAILASYVERYPDGTFAKIAKARIDALKQGGVQTAQAGKAADEMKAKAQAEADKILADAKAQAEKQATAARAEMAKAEQAAKVAADKAAADKAAAEKTLAEAKAAAEKQAAVVAAASAAAAAAQARVQQAAAPAPGPASGAASGAAFVVISSTADGVKKGDRIVANQSINVPNGTRVVLIDGAGRVLTLRGPFNGSPGASESSGIIGRLSEALKESSDAPRRIGAFRGIGGSGSGLGLGTVTVDPWAINTAVAGDWCVAAEQGVMMTGGPGAIETMTVEVVGGAKTDVAWPKSQQTLAWPASVPVKNGATYQIRYGATATAITLHILEKKTASPAQTALWMAEQKCRPQAAAMIDSLERGVSGRLFDLEVAGERGAADYRIGDELKLSIRPSREAYVYCFYKDVAGETTKIFPSQYDANAHVTSGAQAVPAPSWQAPMQLTGPAGQAEVRCFALDRDASAQLPPEIAKPGFNVLPAQVASSLIEVFKRVPDGSVATAAMPIVVKD